MEGLSDGVGLEGNSASLTYRGAGASSGRSEERRRTAVARFREFCVVQRNEVWM